MVLMSEGELFVELFHGFSLIVKRVKLNSLDCIREIRILSDRGRFDKKSHFIVRECP